MEEKECAVQNTYKFSIVAAVLKPGALAVVEVILSNCPLTSAGSPLV